MHARLPVWGGALISLYVGCYFPLEVYVNIDILLSEYFRVILS